MYVVLIFSFQDTLYVIPTYYLSCKKKTRRLNAYLVKIPEIAGAEFYSKKFILK